MPIYFDTHMIKPTAVGAMPHPHDPTFGQLQFLADQGLYYVVMSRSDLKDLADAIEQVLKARPLPADDQQSEGSR